MFLLLLFVCSFLLLMYFAYDTIINKLIWQKSWQLTKHDFCDLMMMMMMMMMTMMTVMMSEP